jgi:outer membrane protein assembly factor BamE (lipoprotein component of BamABCDE complex)
MKWIWMNILCVFLLQGCSDFESPTKGLSVESVVGGGASLVKGMSKDEVFEKWGRPSDKKHMGETRWGAPIERWTYYAWLPSAPVNYRYVSKGRRLFFEGDALVSWEDVKLQKKTENKEQKAEENPEAAKNLDSTASL